MLSGRLPAGVVMGAAQGMVTAEGSPVTWLEEVTEGFLEEVALKPR